MLHAGVIAGLALSAALGLLVPRAYAAEAAPVQALPVQAIWKEAQVNFTYIARTSFYSCDSLERRIERILKDVGARDDIDVRAYGCADSFAPDRFTNVRIKLAIPTAIVPGAGLDAEERSRRELVAKVRGESPADLELAAQFPATWKRVTFSRRTRYLEDGDCELVEQLENGVLEKLDMRIVRSNSSCIPGQIRFGQLNLEVEALVALPSPDTPTEGAPQSPRE